MFALIIGLILLATFAVILFIVIKENDTAYDRKQAEKELQRKLDKLAEKQQRTEQAVLRIEKQAKPPEVVEAVVVSEPPQKKVKPQPVAPQGLVLIGQAPVLGGGAVFGVPHQGMAPFAHLDPDLVGAAGEQPAFHQRDAAAAFQHGVPELGGAGIRCFVLQGKDLLFFQVPAQIAGEGAGGGPGHAVDQTQVIFGDLPVPDLFVENAQGGGGFCRDDDAAGVAVDAVAQGRGKAGLLPGVPVPFII